MIGTLRAPSLAKWGLDSMLTCLFRIDSAKDNDEFFATLRPSMSLVYAGLDLKVGSSGWVPDLVKVTVSDSPVRVCLTLIELEARKSDALISSRKYLPENSGEIVAAFSAYLDRVIRQCKSNAHPHETDFIRLKGTLTNASEVVVRTAGALRSSAAFVEDLPLVDQPESAATPQRLDEEALQERKPTLNGTLRLSQQESQALARTVVVMDAVIRRDNHSAARFHAWRAKSPLRRALLKGGSDKTELCRLILEGQNRGLTLDFEKMLSELSEFWSSAWPSAKNQEAIRRLINEYHPVASAIRGEDRMTRVFEGALKYYPHASV